MGRGSNSRKRQRERKVAEHQLQPAIDAVDDIVVPQAGVIDPVTIARRKVQVMVTLQGRLLDPAEKKKASQAIKSLKTDTLAGQPPTGYYVIVGRGAAAVVNHTTLRQTAWGTTQINGLPVLHVGFDDPWRHYQEHDMGQFPNLLGLPGYHSRPDPRVEDFNAPRKSPRFAADTARELARLRQAFVFHLMRGWAAMIQPRGVAILTTDAVRGALNKMGVDTTPLDKPYPVTWPPYRILVVDEEGKSWLCYAEKIDLCNGSGRPRISFEPYVDQTDVYGAKPWQPPESWSHPLRERAILSGTEALCKQTKWVHTDRVCVMGSGGVAVNMLERGEHEAGQMDWLAKVFLHQDSFGNTRNDPLLKHPLPPAGSGARMTMGEFAGRANTSSPLNPALKKWRFGQGSNVQSVNVQPDQRLDVVIVRSATATPQNVAAQIRDWWEQDVALNAGHFPFSGQFEDPPADRYYNRLIIASGQDFAAVGQPHKLVNTFVGNFASLQDAAGRLVGLISNDGLVRVLGVAATTNAAWVATMAGYAAAQTLQRSMPLQAITALGTSAAVLPLDWQTRIGVLTFDYRPADAWA